MSECVRVAVRVRPLVKSESDKGCQMIIEKIQDEPQVILKTNDSFTFNFVFAPQQSQESLYDEAVKPMIGKLFQGYNVTILAYGQTGSGKTFTMGTAFDGNFDYETGVIPRAIYDIFKQIADMNDYTFSVTCSFMELYQEQLYDLLSSSSREQSVVDIREDGHKGIVIPSLTEIPVTTAKETTECLVKGSSGRAVGATAMNAQSSRSHAIFTVSVQMMKTGDTNSSTSSKFHLVDLAGSERSKKTKATGDRFKEGVKINQGLLALGNVISALGTNQGNGFVGYRDSKLTRLLQDSLGGNSVTLMIACVSPADYNLEETLSTLRYADRARKIKNKPIVNQDPKAAEINRLNGIIQKLRLELCSTKGGNSTSYVMPSEDVEAMQKKMEAFIEKHRDLQLQLQATINDVANIEMRAVVAEQAHDVLQQKVEEVNRMVIDFNTVFNEETCPDEMVEHARKLGEIRKVVDEINGVMEKNKTDILDHKQSISSAGSSLNLTNIEPSMANEAVQRRVDAFTKKQLDMNNELRKLNHELGLKEALHQQVIGNLSKFCSYEESSEPKTREYESMIQILEAEKSDLSEKLKSMKGNPSAKIAEERRIRMNQLESRIDELRKKNLQQAKMLKLREKESEKINNLTREIQSMKAAKVKLVRSMRSESENFRQWKLSREKELTQLKEKDRKRQNEMKRMESLHNKQRNVLKRKVEEAMAINKRLKDALEKRKVAQSQRGKNPSTGKVETVISWIDQELEVIMSVVDAEHSLEHLMEDRAALTSRLQEMKDSSDPNPKDISIVEDDIQMRNAQINDLQQRVVSSDIEPKIKAITDGLQSMPEARAALRHLFTAITEMRKEYASKDSKIEDMKSSYEGAEEKIAELEKENDNTKEELTALEKAYEDKIMVLLKELNNCPKSGDDLPTEISASQKIQQEALDKLEALRDELDQYKRMYNEIKEKLEQQKFKKPQNKGLLKVQENAKLSDSWMTDDDELAIVDDESDDPDWVTDVPLKTKQNNSQNGQKNRSRGSKRGSDGTFRCACAKGFCSTKLCTCRKNESACSENCKCNDQCKNRVNEEKDEHDGEHEENTVAMGEHATETLVNGNETVVLDVHTPNKTNLSVDTLIDDFDTPSYPYAKKKRMPFF